MKLLGKAQAALEFLTTYAWAFLVILILIGALGYFGILSPSKFLPERCSFGSEIGCTDFVIADNGVQLRLRNNAGNPIIVDAVTVSNEKAELTCISSIVNQVWSPGEIKDAPIVCDFTNAGLVKNNKEKLDLKITYHNVGSTTDFSRDVQGEVFAVAGNEKVSNDYLGGGGGIQGMVAAYSFNENDGTTLTDVSGNGDDGTIYGNTRLLMNFDDGTADDKSVYNNDGAINGADCNAVGINGKGCSFDGDGDYVNVGSGTTLNPSQITVEAWARPNIQSTSWNDIISRNSGHGYSLEVVDTAGFGFTIWNSLGAAHIAGAPAFTVGSWYHLVGTFDGSNVRFYQNGNLGETTAFSGTYSPPSATAYIGASDGAGQFFNGIIDEVAIYSKALSQEEIQQHYNAQKAKFTDWVDGKYGNALQFDGVDDYVQTLNNIGITGNSPRSIEMWTYAKSLPTGNGGVVVGWGTGGAKAYSQLVILSNGKWYFWGSGYDYDTGVTVVLNKWEHHAVTFDGTTMHWYRNGVEVGPGQDMSLLNTGNSPVRIGTAIINPHWFNDYFDGIIDSVAIYNRALTPEEIALHANS